MGKGAIHYNGGLVDNTGRNWRSTTIAASPAAATITTIATFTVTGDAAICSGVRLEGWAAFTAGTNAVSALLGIRQTSTTGALIASTGATTVAATDLYALSVIGFDTGAVTPGQVYCLCLTMGSGSATSTVSAVYFEAVLI